MKNPFKKINLKEFFMRWKWRLDNARAIFSMLTFALLLAGQYIRYITALDNLGFWGVMVLSAIAFVAFAIFGYVYDRILKLWSEQTKETILRNPYTYMPNPKEEIFSKGFNTITFLLLKALVEGKEGEELKEQLALAEEIIKEYYSISTQDDYIEEARQLKSKNNELFRLLLRKEKKEIVKS
jgi:hypothetical protein